MGIAGMYLVFSPQPRVRLAFWLRFFVFSQLWTELFRVRGIWLVLVLFGIDMLSITLGAADGIGHDVHLAGFSAGLLSATVLVACRLVRCAGYDLLTWLFGQSDIEQDPEIATGETGEWGELGNTPIIMLPFVAVLLFALAAFIYRLTQLVHVQ
jgi:hypothetical protein